MSNSKLFIHDVYDTESIYFDKMLQLIKNPNPLNEKYTELHHIIPRFIYKDNNLPIDNSDENVVKLSIKNHILVHYYAAKCCLQKYKYKCICCVVFTLGKLSQIESEEQLNDLAQEIADTKKMYRQTEMPPEIRAKCSWDHYRFSEAERKEKFGKQSIGNTYRTGIKHTAETRSLISKKRKGKTLRHQVSAETRKKIGDANRGRKVGFDQNIRTEVGKFNQLYMETIKQKYDNYDLPWNEYQKYISQIKQNVLDEMKMKYNLAVKEIRKRYKKEIIDEVLKRL